MTAYRGAGVHRQQFVHRNGNMGEEEIQRVKRARRENGERWGSITYHDESADERSGRLGLGADDLGDEIGRHADDANQGDELQSADDGEGVPEGAETGHGAHLAGAVCFRGTEFLFEGFEGGDEGELGSLLVIRPRGEARRGEGESGGGV